MNTSTLASTLFFLSIFTCILPAQQGQSPMPALPPDIPKNATIWLQLIDKTPSGQDAVWTTPDGYVSEFYQLNDQGRSPKTYSTCRLNKRAIVTYEETKGVDYMKSPINDTFSIKDAAGPLPAFFPRQSGLTAKYRTHLQNRFTDWPRLLRQAHDQRALVQTTYSNLRTLSIP